jgi:hypothetical protein
VLDAQENPILTRSRVQQVPGSSATKPAGQAITLAGATVLRFDADGLVVDHVDYWVQSQGRTVPYDGWARPGISPT